MIYSSTITIAIFNTGSIRTGGRTGIINGNNINSNNINTKGRFILEHNFSPRRIFGRSSYSSNLDPFTCGETGECSRRISNLAVATTTL